MLLVPNWYNIMIKHQPQERVSSDESETTLNKPHHFVRKEVDISWMILFVH
jgi:hypothetical protein